MKTSATIDLQVACSAEGVPDVSLFTRWATAAVGNSRASAEISIRVVDAIEGAELNQHWRNKQGPTNVLSFPCDFPDELNIPLLGDLVICAPVIAREAREQHKTPQAHWAHMVIHGTLHLLGYDHIEDSDARVMELLEIELLEALGFPNPYQATPSFNHSGEDRR
ncbi:rRNA maturation RNase YbeY [Candidatus Sororendozoicomonas aggregata]|uniref:rRNA maturation RNase YbeY n=1 Tax=Candidatus Sororendozoicomonas aggregata TaxID=3073239 RepID=UPI002ED44D5D